jgi:chromosome segregation ATPase
MSAPAEALTKFWEDLREKSRIRVEHPDLPDELKTSAGELTAALWDKAQALAQESLLAYRREAEAAVLEARSAQETADGQRDLALREAASAQESLRQTGDQVRALEQQVAAQGATREALEQRIERAGQEVLRLQAALDEARREFSAELEKQRAVAHLAEERFQAAEGRALLEIDRERTLAGKLQKELDQTRTGASQAAERHRSEMAAVQTELGDLRQQTGILEGNLQAAVAGRDRMSADLEALRIQLTEAVSRASAFRVEGDNWRHRAEEVQQTVVDLQAKAGRRQRKAGPDQKEGKLL